jgi:uncharacterized membrane protein
MDVRDMTWGTERLVALSDGVFAIILTLLVLELKLPDLPPGYGEASMIDALLDRLHTVAAWVLSFCLVARLWFLHHNIFANLARCQRRTIELNFIMLGVCSLVPFGAALIGTYKSDPFAIAFFSGIFGASSLTAGLLARHAVTETHLHHASADTVFLRRQRRYYAVILPGIAVLAIMMMLGMTFAFGGPLVPGGAPLLVWLVEPVVAYVSEQGTAAHHTRPNGGA